MRAIRSVGWPFRGLLLASALCAAITVQLIVPSAAAHAAPHQSLVHPSYIKLEPGTLLVGGVDDLIKDDHALTLLPVACQGLSHEVKLGIGFIVDADFVTLDLSATIKAPRGCGADIFFRDFFSGDYFLHHHLDLSDPDIALEGLAVDSAVYKHPITSEVELRFSIRCSCGPPPTDQDAVSVQDLSLGPIPK